VATGRRYLTGDWRSAGFYARNSPLCHRVFPLSVSQVDAFRVGRFRGNPAAVCPLTGWLDDGLRQAVAAENNLLDTEGFWPERLAALGWTPRLRSGQAPEAAVPTVKSD